ncbi:MAG: glycosyltransferase [Desulfuromonadales bacterium]|nr:glycosyltransferase [Desulfuromonadales bacterium]
MSSPSEKTSAVSVVIPNYNGRDLLRDNLPSIFHALETWGGTWELIVVDDCSSDDSCRVIKEQFPTARLLINPTNSGFSKTCNIGMAMARYPVLLCINTDVRAAENLIGPLLSHFNQDDVFAVTPRIVVEREGKNQGSVSGAFRRGFLKGAFARDDEESGSRENLYAIGACVAYDADKFRSLGGYSEMYSPYLFEDVDIAYRAWKRGWKSIYEPDVTTWHFSNATLGRVKRRRNKVIYFRNRFIFHWVNLSDPWFVAMNLLNTLIRLLFSFLWCNFVYYEAFWGACKRLPEILSIRRTEKVHRRRGDAEIIRCTARSPGIGAR